MATEPELKPPKRGKGDIVHTAVKAALGSIPMIGAPATELFQAIVQPPLERRRDEWMREVGEKLEQLMEQHSVAVEDLRTNEVFLDTVLQATAIAMRSNRDEKREALRNAIANAALPHAPDESEQQMFLQLVDRFTIWHLRALSLFSDPPAWFKSQNRKPRDRYTASLSAILEEAFAEMAGRRDFYDQVWRDLHASGLVNTDGLHAMMTAKGLMESRTTARGRAFLRFVNDPLDAGAQKVNH